MVVKYSTSQWRIKDFPGGEGGTNPDFARLLPKTYYLIFAENPWTEWGGGVHNSPPGRTPLDPPMLRFDRFRFENRVNQMSLKSLTVVTTTH